MKINKKALELIEKGLSAKTVSKLTESQVNILHSKLLGEQVQEMPAKKSYKVGQEGGNLPPTTTNKGYTIKPTDDGVIATPNESELGEEEEVVIDPNKETETQDPKQIGPSSDDGFGTENDGMDEEISLENHNEKEIGEGKKKSNPWAICTAQLGNEFGTRERHLWSSKEKNKYERCVKDVKQSLKEGKNPVSLFLENQIINIVEKHMPPRITKGELIKYLTEQQPSVEPTTKPAPTKPGTRPGTKPRPSHPGQNPNPGENPAPKAKKISPDQAKDEVIDAIMKLLKK